jgi:hypothetical protein
VPVEVEDFGVHSTDPVDYPDIAVRVSAAAFRAMALERLRAVERDVAELKTRVNGLIFVVIGAVVTQLVLRVAG